MKPLLPFVETMITQVCNLSCQGCTNYSDLKHSGFIPWEQGQEQITNWLSIIDIPDFGIMGGEPLINPQVRQWIRGVRELMPNSQIRFTTNGLLLEKNIDIVDLLCDVGNSVFKITVHLHDAKLEQLIEKIFKRYDFKPIQEYGIDRWAYGSFRVQINRPTTFLKTYQGTYKNMLPYNSNPQDAFKICCQQNCPLLYQEKIYKCSTSGLLNATLERFGHINKAEWQKFITSTDHFITTKSDRSIIDAFIKNFNQPNNICQMCPESNDLANLNHKTTVTFK